MAAITPRRSLRIPHQHTPKMSERKKGLFQSDSEASRDSLTKHRELRVVDSESESEDFDLGIMGALDSSSCDETDSNLPRTPVKSAWGTTTRSQTNKLLKENNDLKNFIKSPFTLKKYQTRYTADKHSGSMSTPATPLQHHIRTPSSTHSCASRHTPSSTSSKARKSLASLIADTESCSSSLKDLNFDTDSASDSKENTPTKPVRRSRRQKLTPKLSFTGILKEQKKNSTPIKNPVVFLTQLNLQDAMSPTQLLKTPHNTSESNVSPPKLSHRRAVQIEESPESACESEKSNKRLQYDNKMDIGPSSKHPRLEPASKARLSLFNCDRLKEILSAKSFYGKSNPELTTTVAAKISRAVQSSSSHRRRLFPQSTKRKRKPGQINMGVRHRIRRPKVHKRDAGNKMTTGPVARADVSQLNSTASSGFNNSTMSDNNASMLSQSSQELPNDKADPFDKEKQTIEALLSQWTEEEVPESELTYKPPPLPCFNTSVMAETDSIFKPVTAVPVPMKNMPENSDIPDRVILELDERKFTVTGPVKTESRVATVTQDVVMEEAHGDGEKPLGLQALGGEYILVDENSTVPALPGDQITDLDSIERELQELDAQILRMAHSNNMDGSAVLASTQTPPPDLPPSNPAKLFPIFSKPNPGIDTTPKATDKSSRKVLKTGGNQYVIDAGQKRFGAIQCKECGVIYEVGDAQDEHDHLVHHNASDVLRFNGLKDEYIVGRAATARCIRIRGGDPGWKKVHQLLERVVHPYLGYGASLPQDMIHCYTAYLYVDKKQIVGCLIVEPKVRAYKLMPGEPDCCSLEAYPVKCGVSRIWTHISYRRRGLASRLVDCARASFLHGTALRVEDLAFSAPTVHGKAFARAYTGVEDFYVYLD